MAVDDRADEVAAPAPSSRQPHAVLDLPSRRWKARKIESLLQLDAVPGAMRLLEIGTGSGGIAHYFGTRPGGRFEVDAVDVVDSRQVTDGYRFARVDSVALPFADGRFDVVISNHVIEHVGDSAQQLRHLQEVRRVLAPEGRLYLALPNRWMLVEPHFRLPFLSWLPRAWRSAYVRLARRGAAYDCEPLQLAEVESLLRRAGFDFRNVGAVALRETLRIERPGSRIAWLADRIPGAWIHALRAVNPTHVYIAWARSRVADAN